MTYLDNPEAIFPLTVDPTAPDRDAQLLAAARGIVPSWAGAGGAEVAVVSGGITNLLFRLRAPGRPPLLARIYGRNTEVVIDREGENRLFARLSAAGFAPTYHGRFENGRIEGWLDGYRPLEPQEMGDPVLRRLIGARLRELHAIPAPAATPTLWETLRGWMSEAQAVSFEGADAARHAALELPRFAAALAALEARYRREIAALPSSPGADAARAAVLAHNDLLSGNVLFSEAEGAVRFVDYEYGACSYAAFDVANHFCEYAGFDSDFELGFPTRAVRDDFIDAYLGPGAAASDVAAFSDIVEFFVLPDHLFWGTWAVVQARWSPIDFDFMEYARLRLAGFDYHRRGI